MSLEAEPDELKITTVGDEWERCKAWLQAAVERDGGHYDIDDVLKEIATGGATFWPGRQCAAVTQFWQFPKCKALNYWLAGGDMRELVDEMLPFVEQWGRLQGCSKIIISGREGWGRVLKPLGYRMAWVSHSKDLDMHVAGRC